jgi:hypothetical protein
MADRRTIGIIIVALLIAAAVFYGLRYTGVVPGAGTATSGYQAVFLSNGQVYFGKVSSTTSSDLVLEDIYYLQVEGQIQPEQQGTQQPKLSLVKLGNELHGPQDKMIINRDHVLFWENLKDDGKVVSAIKDHKAGKTTTTPSTTPATGQ